MISFAAAAITTSVPRMHSAGFQATSADPSPRSAPRSDVKQALMACGIFGNTDPDVVSTLAESHQPLRFPPRHVVFAQGDPGTSLFLVVSGRAKVTYSRGDGRDVVINVAGPRDVFGEVTAFDQGPCEFTAITVTEVRAIADERDQLVAWAIVCPQIAHQIMRLLARRVDVMTSSMVDFAFAPPTHRLASRLLLLCKRFGR
jgi:CRP/FNR family transcriptional regulator, cyclic AMP receptor protein